VSQTTTASELLERSLDIAGAGGDGDAPRRTRAASWLARNAIAVVSAALFVVLCFASDAFLSKTNLLNILAANADVGIVACAATLVIIAGGLDVSVGAVYALGGVVSAKVALHGSVGVGIAAGLATGLVAGLFNGTLVTWGRVNSFVATLATAIMFQSVAQVLTGADLITPSQASFVSIGRDSFLGIKWIIWLFVFAAVATGVLLGRARFGRHNLVVGANLEAARLSGVPVQRVRCATFVITGLAAAIAGVTVTSQSGQADPNIGGLPFVLSVVAAISVGGVSLRGGDGAIWRTVLGVLFLGMATNGLHLLNVDPKYDDLFIGLLILVAAFAHAVGRRMTRDRDASG
jgi:ribose transport system permease protein